MLAVVISLLAAFALIVLGCVVRKRRNVKPRLLSLSAARELAIDEGNTWTQLPANPLPLLSSQSQGLIIVSAANAFKGADDIEIPVVDTFAGAGPPTTEAPLDGSKNDGVRGGLFKQGYSKPIPDAEIDGAGGTAGVGAGGGVVVPSVGYIDPATHAGSHRVVIGRGAFAVVGDNTGPTSHASNAGGGGSGFSPEEGDAESNLQSGVGGSGAGGVDHEGIGQGDYPGSSVDWELSATTSTVNISTGEQYEFNPASDRGGVDSALSVAEESSPVFDETIGSSSTGRRELARVIGEAALDLAHNSQIAGVSQAAEAVSILVNLLTDDQNNKMSNEASLRRCRSIVVMLTRATKVLGKVRWRFAIGGVAAPLYLVWFFLLRSYLSVIMFPLQ